MSKLKKNSNRSKPIRTKETLDNLIKKNKTHLEKSPQDLKILQKHAKYLFEICFYDLKYKKETIECFDKILDIDNKNIEILKLKAELLTNEETIIDAELCYDQVLKIEPNDAEAWWGKGVIVLINKKPYSAITYFDKSLELDPYDARVWMQKGFALSARGETWDQAIECFDNALKINTDDTRVWKARGSVYQKQNNLDNAILDFDKVIQLDKNEWDAIMLKGFALIGKHDYENALQCFNKSLNINENNIEAFNGKGSTYFFMKKYEESLEMYNRVTKLDSKYIEGWIQKGYCSIKLNDKKNALTYFQKVLELDPNDIRVSKEIESLKGISKKKKIVNTNHVVKQEDYALIVENVSKKFRIYHEKNDSLFSMISNSLTKKNTEELKVLKNIDFKLKKGEMLGIIGANGSGKTTLLKILSGILSPDEGSVKKNGIIAPLLQLGVGFNGELTAKENIILAGMLLGFSKSEMKNKANSIIEFSELKKFADTKIKNFSTGMSARLAFTTAIQINPDILLVDEVLAVGDINFVKKSYREFLSFREQGKSIILVSHSLEHIKNLCDRVMIIESGKIKMIGNAKQVVEHYIQSNT